MKPILFFALLLIVVATCLVFSQKLAYAQDTPTGTPVATPSAASLDSQTSTNLIISAIESFFKSLDSLSGGFIFTTPDFFTNTVTLKGPVITGLNAYRNIFYLLSIPVSAIIIFWFSLRGAGTTRMQFLKQFAIRVCLYVCFLVFLVPLLSVSIHMTNLLNASILSVSGMKEQSIVSFVTEYFTAAQREVASGRATPESFGFSNPSFFDIMRSIPHVITQLFFLLLIVFTLTIGIIFIFMQFVVRFLSMLFLSVIFPLVGPFILTERTEGIVNSYLRLWFTFLIHQPAFLLGFAIVMLFVRSLLQSGVSIALVFLYIASLFFLGTVNILASRVFADFWISAGLNLEAGAITRTVISTPAILAWKTGNKIFDHVQKTKTIDHSDTLPKREQGLHAGKRKPDIHKPGVKMQLS